MIQHQCCYHCLMIQHRYAILVYTQPHISTARIHVLQLNTSHKHTHCRTHYAAIKYSSNTGAHIMQRLLVHLTVEKDIF